MIKLDLHVHSMYSADATGTPKEIMKSVLQKKLQGFALTDHNTIKGALKAAKELSTKEFIVIPGIEISTKHGHLIGLNVGSPIPKGLPIDETVEKIYESGGTPIVPHLFRNMSGIKKERLMEIKHHLDAIEVYNGCSQPKSNVKNAQIAKELNLGGTGGSDSHIPLYAGYAYTIVNTTNLDCDTIITEIKKRKTWGAGNSLPFSYRQERTIQSISQFFKRGLKRI
ncbi:MAG: CehA/McbA family metallohydrolase [Candidatus Thermoplasmatota archaeon]|nr:CehA/McbA family metallohydrolase [Candidatus Thermoplasmatota archaeon]